MIDFMTLTRWFGPLMDRRVLRQRHDMIPYLESYGQSISSKNSGDIQKVSGTFIYNRPPDYAGAPSVNWKVSDWCNEFDRLKRLGIDTVIYQGCFAERTTGELFVYYPISAASLEKLSSIKKRVGREPVIEPKLDDVVAAAEKSDMNLHLGLYNVLSGWYGLPSQKLIYQVQSEELLVAADLVRLYANSSALKGWYISPEIIFLSHGHFRSLDMNAFVKPIAQYLRKQTPDKRIGMSPGSLYNEKWREKIISFWIKTLQGTEVDLLYPQDSVGVLTNPPQKSHLVWEMWREVADKTGIELWANCEAFERNTFNEEKNPLVAAPFTRFLWQLESATPHVKKIVSWECMHFLKPDGALGSGNLLSDYNEFFNNKKTVAEEDDDNETAAKIKPDLKSKAKTKIKAKTKKASKKEAKPKVKSKTVKKEKPSAPPKSGAAQKKAKPAMQIKKTAAVKKVKKTK